jgi:beta-N-acetylhexosaminidase
VHENLIHRASCIIIVTADANRNLYQAGFTKHVAMMCSMLKATGQKKSLVVVAVSSPYDFAMDKTVGTYICTFDFTETAMAALVRALFGAFPPHGTLPGTLRKSKKVLKPRQHWLVESYDRDRDAKGLDDLVKALARASAPNQQFLQTTTAGSYELFNPNIEEAHFVVRNSSTQALYGFCATYYAKGTGIIGAIFVDPAKRNVSIGRSLHRRALRGLAQKRGIKKVQLGMCFPGVYPGIPVDDNSASLKSWFTKNGWDLQFPRRLANMAIPELSSWSPPEGLLQSIQRASITFDLIHGLDNAESVLNHVATHANPEVFELYKIALQETKTCGVVRAKSPVDSLLGTVIICSPGSILAGYIPVLQPTGAATVVASASPPPRDQLIGGIIAPVVPSTAQATLVLQGLALMGVRQNKAHKSGRSALSWVHDEAFEALLAMGFDVLQAFEEISNSPDNVRLLRRSIFSDTNNDSGRISDRCCLDELQLPTHGHSFQLNTVLRMVGVSDGRLGIYCLH